MSTSRDTRLKSRKERLEHKARMLENGWEFPLSTTSLVMGEEVKARVRRIDLFNQARLKLMPTDFQNAVSEGLKYLSEVQEKARDEGLSDDTLMDRVSNNRRLLPSADAFCMATWIDPKLFASDAEAEEWQRRNPDADVRVWVLSDDDDLTDVEAADRIEYFYACLNADSQSARKLKPFRPRSVIDVEHRTVGEADGGAATPDPEPAYREERGPVEVLPIG